jgi:YD repeat-containing protein
VGHELVDTAGKTVAEICDRARSRLGLRLIGHTVQFYDGPAFEGLPFGQLGRFGALVRTETLAMTKAQLDEAYDANPPPYLSSDDEIPWPASYPAEFAKHLPAHAGYVFRSTPPYSPGFYVRSLRRAYDFQPAGTGRGLITTTRDPLGNDTTATYDQPYRILPTTITDTVGLQTVAAHDYRLLQPKRVTDPNGHVSEATFTPLGMVKEVFVRGRDGEGDGDHPSIAMEYGYRAFDLEFRSYAAAAAQASS